MNKINKLKPCFMPGCDGSAEMVNGDCDLYPTRYIKCSSCGEQTSDYSTWLAAITVWNEAPRGSDLLDMFAAAVLPSIYLNGIGDGSSSRSDMASEAYWVADAMLAARSEYDS